jgi:hypothetical protein
MEGSYAVEWHNGDGRQYAGRLDLGPTALRLEGVVVHDVDYAELTEVGITRQLDERLGGRPTIVLRDRGGRTFRLASIGEPGALREVAEQLTRQLAS